MKRANTIKAVAVLAAVIGLTISFSPGPAYAQEEILLAMVTNTDALDEIGRAYRDQRVELTSVKKEANDESIVNQMIQEAGDTVAETAAAEGWPTKLLGYVPYEIMTGDYGGLFMRLAF